VILADIAVLSLSILPGMCLVFLLLSLTSETFDRRRLPVVVEEDGTIMVVQVEDKRWERVV
jgi:hypothetical protein